MRGSSVQHRDRFLKGAIPGLALVIFKLLVYLPVDFADILYGIVLLLTLVITTGQMIQSKFFVLEARYLDLIAGFLFPLDAYAILVLLGIPLTN